MPPGGAINDFDLIRFGGPTVASEFSVNVGVSATRILKNDPDRLSITMTNLGANPLYWSINSNPSAAAGQLLGAGQTVVIQVQNDGETCGRDVWGAMPAGAGDVNVLILRRQSPAR